MQPIFGARGVTERTEAVLARYGEVTDLRASREGEIPSVGVTYAVGWERLFRTSEADGAVPRAPGRVCLGSHACSFRFHLEVLGSESPIDCFFDCVTFRLGAVSEGWRRSGDTALTRC